MKRRDIIIAVGIALNFGYLVWRMSHGNEIPIRPITSISPQELIGDPKTVGGNPRAKYTIVEFGDYQCPPCARMYTDLSALISREQRLRFQFRHYPLPSHKLSYAAAMLAENARRSNQFEAVHRELYGLGARVNDDNLHAIAEKYGVPYATKSIPRKVCEELDSHILRDKLCANRIPIHGTPAIFLCTPDNAVLQVYSVQQIRGLLR